MKIYLVGGAVRDELLGLPVTDRDWLVVGATEEEMRSQGYTQLDGDFPVFLHPDSGEEYALAREEEKAGIGYKGFAFNVDPSVTLEQDLARRDLTINAMARSEGGELLDPYDGQSDLTERYLRHVTPAFVEDPLRVLRVARFAASFSHLGFRIAHSTFKLMKQMSQKEELESLPGERVWNEMKLAMNRPQPWRFFETLHRCGALEILVPALTQQWPPVEKHQAEQADPLAPMKRAVALGLEPEVCFALLVNQVAGDHGVGEVSQQLPLERPYLEAASDLQQLASYGEGLAAKKIEAIWELIQRTRALQQPERFWSVVNCLLVLSGQDHRQQQGWISDALSRVRQVSSDPLLKQGLTGKALGEALCKLRLKALSDALERQNT